MSTPSGPAQGDEGTSRPDRRKQPRYVVDVPVRILAAGKPSTGHLRDICRDAAWVESDRALAMGAQLALVMELPGTGGPIEVLGRVIRLGAGEKAPNGMAILFDELPPAAATRIDFFIALQG